MRIDWNGISDPNAVIASQLILVNPRTVTIWSLLLEFKI